MCPPCLPQKWSTQGDHDPDKSLTALGQWRVRQINLYCFTRSPKSMGVVSLRSCSHLAILCVTATTMQISSRNYIFLVLLSTVYADFKKQLIGNYLLGSWPQNVTR